MIKKTPIIKILLFTSIFLMAMSCNYSYNQELNFEKQDPMKLLPNIKDQHTTIFVHGTLFGLSWLVRLLDCPLGLTLAEEQGDKYVLGRIPYLLNAAAPLMFPLNKFYLWGWHGELSFDGRKEASHELYHAIKPINGPKTIIGQSHGCNVALNLAKISQQHRDKDFAIDLLILLSGPVQEANSHLVSSPIFKKVFSLYSAADLLQVLDPQGLYAETQKLKKKTKFFSEKLFKPAPNLVQAEIIINDKSPSHLDFITAKFIKYLPDIIELLDDATKDKTNYEEFHYKINIPLMGKPHFVN